MGDGDNFESKRAELDRLDSVRSGLVEGLGISADASFQEIADHLRKLAQTTDLPEMVTGLVIAEAERCAQRIKELMKDTAN